MIADPSPSLYPSLPPACGSCRVVELADEFKVSSAEMLAICDRVGVDASDASQWLDAATVDRIRDVVGLKGPGVLLKPEKSAKAEKPNAEKPTAEKAPQLSRDGVRPRRVLAIAVLIGAFSLAIGVLLDKRVNSGTNIDGSATVVTAVDE